MFRIFSRTWWRHCPSQGWPNDLEPHFGPKRFLRRTCETEDEARKFCTRLNAGHMTAEQIRLGFKYEYTSKE